jgi:hypothetical protein
MVWQPASNVARQNKIWKREIFMAKLWLASA